MQQQSAASRAASQAPDGDRGDEVRSPDGDLVDSLGWLNAAVVEAGYSHDAIAAHTERDRSYVTRVLAGDKPVSLTFLLALPKDVQAGFAKRYAEARGFLVVRPVSPDLAVQHVVSGLIGLLAPRPALPATAHRMAKAALPYGERRKAAG